MFLLLPTLISLLAIWEICKPCGRSVLGRYMFGTDPGGIREARLEEKLRAGERGREREREGKKEHEG